ncbi:MAG: hypothetical protein QOK49_3226 [Baekduia sp.]|jgi:hypothetical protein|nr:hypothetical protein [Baekduia sp.]
MPPAHTYQYPKVTPLAAAAPKPEAPAASPTTSSSSHRS